MDTRARWLALLIAGLSMGLVGCGTTCSGDCVPPTLFVRESAAVVRVVADPPCTAQVFQLDGAVQIGVTVSPYLSVTAAPLSCQIYEWLSDGTELVAFASFTRGSGPCCSDVYADGTLSPFTPVDGGAP
jgi:hypothetical protein